MSSCVSSESNSDIRKDLRNGMLTQFGKCLYKEGDSGGKVNILGRDTVGHCETISSYEHLSNSEWLPRYSSFDLQIQNHCE